MMNKLINELEFFLAWLVFWLCTAVGGFVLGAVVGAIVGGMLGVAGYDITHIKLICGVLGFLVGIPVSYIMFRLFVGLMIVRKIEKRIPINSESRDSGI